MLPRRYPAPDRRLPLTCGDLPAWLCAPGSLTARLRSHGVVTVRVLQQGHRPLWRQEQRALGERSGHVREVMLMVDGRPAVWARSVTTLRAARGAWRAMKGLGTRPLAELLFAHRRVHRGPLQASRFPSSSPEGRHLARGWQTRAPEAIAATPSWARHSIFRHKGHPLQVLEAFSPWVGGLEAGRTGAVRRGHRR
ncbi:chorismate--pyruvate lyase [Aquabacterium olei]|uniref:Probable chorismate pyruvate-lyase n=1 Tax=Aquabacterium olei TaxID=1296669 RepID=A0A2U8FSF8_9BURK|nr:chorismate--pyruvate lyase [Aquabacterium olei]